MTLPAFPIFNMLAPTKPDGSPGDPVCAFFSADFSTIIRYDFNLLTERDNGEIKTVQGVYIDNKSNANAVTLLSNVIGHDITVKGRTQGYYPIMCADPADFTVTSTAGAGAITKIFFLNIPVPAFQWLTQ